MASGSPGRTSSGSKGFDFASDDILCSYEDYSNNRDSNSNGNGNLTDPSKDIHKSRMGRTSMFPAPAYNPPEDSSNQDVIAMVENSMKKHTDNLMRFLEGISSRLSQLELYCYNLDKSIGEMRSDLNRDHGEQDSKLKSLEKHIEEVHRSVQILRDKQELSETQKELANLQLSPKDSISSSHSPSNEEKSLPSTTDPKKTDSASDENNQQLALALPHQIAPQQQPAPPPPPQAPHQNVTQATPQPSYYMPPTHLPNPQAVPQIPQNQYLPSDQQYRVPPQQTPPSQVTPSPPVHQFSQYQQPQQQQQWPQQVQPPQPQPPSLQQTQMRPPSPTMYPPYQPSQATNQSPAETLPNSMPYPGAPPQGTNRADAVYGYGGGSGRTVPPQQPPPQHMKGSFPAQQGEAYGPPASGAYMRYDGGEGGRTTHHAPQQQQFPHYVQGGYPPASGSSIQNPNHMVRNPNPSQFLRNHPHSELIEKLVSMGFRGDHVASVIQRMEESGQAIDFNSVLDRLNVHGSVGPHRGGWSG